MPGNPCQDDRFPTDIFSINDSVDVLLLSSCIVLQESANYKCIFLFSFNNPERKVMVFCEGCDSISTSLTMQALVPQPLPSWVINVDGSSFPSLASGFYS